MKNKTTLVIAILQPRLYKHCVWFVYISFWSTGLVGWRYIYLRVVIVDFCASGGLAVGGSCVADTSAGLNVRQL